MIDLIELFDLGTRELVAFTGGGGKTTLLHGLSRQLAVRGDRVLVTTTTKLGLDQTGGVTICWSVDSSPIASALDRPGPVFVLSGGDDRKVLGFSPELIDGLFDAGSAEYVLVEADGSRGRPLKAPAAHEPVVPATASLVIVVIGVDAVGRTFADAAHRPESAVALTGMAESDVITPEAAATIVGHPGGGLKGIPDPARVAIAITKVDPDTRRAAAAIKDLLASNPRIERVVTLPFDDALASGRD